MGGRAELFLFRGERWNWCGFVDTDLHVIMRLLNFGGENENFDTIVIYVGITSI